MSELFVKFWLKEDMLKHVNHRSTPLYDKNYMYLSCDKEGGNQGSKEFYVLPNEPSELKSLIMRTFPSGMRNYYMVVFGDQLQKIKFDIDLKQIDAKTKFNVDDTEWAFLRENMKQGIKSAIQKAMETVYGVKKITLSICNSSTDDKISYHFVLNHKVVQNAEEAKEFALRVKALDEFKRYTRFIDMAVYSGFQNWRLPYCCKLGKDNFKTIEDGSFEDALINLTKDEFDTAKLNTLPLIVVKPTKKEMVIEKEIEPVEGELENLIDLIYEDVLASNNPLCDDQVKNKLNYDNWKSLILAIAKCSNGTGIDLAKKCIELYRSKDEYDMEKMVERMMTNSDYAWGYGWLRKYAKNNPRFRTVFPNIGSEYERMKEEFEKTNFKLNNETVYCQIVDEGRIIRRPQKKLKERYANLLLSDGDDKQKDFCEVWIRDKNIRNYDMCGVYPEGCSERIYNTWDGFRAEKFETGGECDSFVNLVKRLCNYNEEHFDFVIKVIAQIIQEPHKKVNICLVFKSYQGAGKDTLYLILQAVIGALYCFNTADVERDIFGRFNDAIENKILIALNECSVVQTGKHSQKFKDFITCSVDKIEEKGIGLRTVRSMARYFIFTNSDFALNIEELDRRFFVIDCKQPKLTQEESRKIYDDIDNEKCIRAFYDYLMNVDITSFDFVSNRPHSQYQEDIKEACLPMEHLFLRELKDYSQGETKVFTTDLYGMFCNFSVKMGVAIDKTCTARTFTLKMAKYANEPDSGVSRPNAQGTMRIGEKMGKGFVFDFELIEKRFN